VEIQARLFPLRNLPNPNVAGSNPAPFVLLGLSFLLKALFFGRREESCA
jgi:hypothetical protein